MVRKTTIILSGIGESEQLELKGVSCAFESLLVQFQELKNNINESIIRSAKENRIDRVQTYAEKAQKLEETIVQVESIFDDFSTEFIQNIGPGPKPPPPLSSTIRLVLEKKCCKASAIFEGGPVTLLSGSTITANEFGSLAPYLKVLRAELKRDNKLSTEESGHNLILNQELKFTSPSAAAGFVLGRSASGNKEWIDKESGRELGKIRKELGNK